MKDKLKPCPFCGGKAVSDTLQNESTVQCVNPDCDVIANVSGFGCDVDIDIWNTRPIEDELSARIADLEQELIDQAEQHAKILAPILNPKYRHQGCAITQRACSSGCPYWSDFADKQVDHKAPKISS